MKSVWAFLVAWPWPFHGSWAEHESVTLIRLLCSPADVPGVQGEQAAGAKCMLLVSSGFVGMPKFVCSWAGRESCRWMGSLCCWWVSPVWVGQPSAHHPLVHMGSSLRGWQQCFRNTHVWKWRIGAEAVTGTSLPSVFPNSLAICPKQLNTTDLALSCLRGMRAGRRESFALSVLTARALGKFEWNHRIVSSARQRKLKEKSRFVQCMCVYTCQPDWIRQFSHR